MAPAASWHRTCQIHRAPMRADLPAKMASAGRWILLTLLAGHLLLRQEFAHRTLGEIVQWLGLGEWGALRHAYFTEAVLLLLLPVAVASLLPPLPPLFKGGRNA